MNNGLTCELAFRQKNGRFLKMFKFDDFLKEYQKFHCSEIIDLLNNTQVVLLQELRNQTQIYNLLLSNYSACSSLLKISNDIQLFKTYNTAIAIYKYSNYSAEKLTESCEHMYAAMLDFFSVLSSDYLLYNEPYKILNTLSRAKIFLLSSHMINSNQTKDEKIKNIDILLCDYEKLLRELEISMLKSLAIPNPQYHTQYFGAIPLDHPNIYYLYTQKQYYNEDAYFNDLREVFDQRKNNNIRIEDPREVALLWIDSERAYNKEYSSFLGKTTCSAPKFADYDELDSEAL